MSRVARLLSAVQRYSARAEEAHTRADQMENLAAREAMLDVAASYEHLEDIARAHLQSLSAAQQPSRRHQIASSDPNPYDKKPVWD